MKCKGLVGSLAVLALVALTPQLWAGDGAPAAQAVRLGNVDGRVQITQDGQLLADPALVNTPLFEGSQVAALDEGRAELQFEDGSVARLSPNSSVLLKVLSGQGASVQAEIELLGGLGYFELKGAAGQMRIRFGESVVTASGPTILRINLDNLPGELAVFSGNAHLERGGKASLDLQGGESVTLNNADASRYNLAESIEPDSWDAWNADRDEDLAAEGARRTGAESGLADSGSQAWNDLDASGNWYNVPGEGMVWAPYDAANAGWDPYGNGYWMWTPRFGYIWVSGDAWGYMPYQCGAWNFYNDFGWGWAPGMCSPWWGGGGGYYGINIGRGPGGYRFPVRPHRPIGGRGHGPHPLVPVNHRPASGIGPGARGRNAPVTIGGHTLLPLRPLAPRSAYGQNRENYVYRPQPGGAGVRTPFEPGHSATPGAGGNRPGFVPAPGGNHPGTVQAPKAPSGGNRPAPSGKSSSGGGSSHSSGGGGGGSHSSGGSSGGGGGGGSHSSGGGGGGGRH